MQHCQGGPGPWVFNSNPETFARDATSDLYGQLMMWVEHGVAPETLLGTKYFNDTGPEILFQRPICPYPSEAVWTGMGQWQDPSTWTCKTDGVEV
jgi:feruloyl esterase